MCPWGGQLALAASILLLLCPSNVTAGSSRQLAKDHPRQTAEAHPSAVTVGLEEALIAVRRPGSKGMVVPLLARHGVVRERGLLRNGSLPILGAIREVGYFYTLLQLGTPPRRFSVIIDTGSTITYIACAKCKHCGKHADAAFDPDASSTSLWLPCNDRKCNCGSPSCTCSSDRQCYYSRSYAEGSSSEGWLIEDDFVFPDNSTAVRLVFGCENGETGEIFRQTADGILGMGNNNNAFPSQLVATGVIDDTFGLCFGFPQGGTMLLGDVALPPNAVTVYTPLVPNTYQHYYNVQLNQIVVDGVPVPGDAALYVQGYGTVLDSGTTFTYLPTQAFNAFADLIGNVSLAKGLQRTPGADPQYNDICWKGAPDKFEGLDGLFPEVHFVFDGNAVLRQPPYRYLFYLSPGAYCLGVFDNGNQGTLIGGVSVRNVLVQYERRTQRVGFTEAKCDGIWSAAAPDAPSATAGTETAPPPQAPPPRPQPQPRPAPKAAAPAGTATVTVTRAVVILFVALSAVALVYSFRRPLARMMQTRRHASVVLDSQEMVGLVGGKGIADSTTPTPYGRGFVYAP